MKFFKLFASSILVGSLFLSTSVFSFTDVPADYVYQEAVDNLEALDILDGYDDGTLKVNANVNRAEFLKLILELVDAEVGDLKNCFPDVSDEWFAKYVCFAEEKGFVDGYEDGLFLPEQQINFVEAAKILKNVLVYSWGGELKWASINAYYENDDPSLWFRPYVESFSYKNIIPPSIQGLDQYLTRGEVIELLHRVYQWEHNSSDIDFSESAAFFWFNDGEVTVLNMIGKIYMKNDSGVFYSAYGKGGRVIIPMPTADVETFQVVNDHHAMDKNHAYSDDKVIDGADLETFAAITEIDDVYTDAYVKDKNHVYFYSGIMEWADPKTFEILSGWYMKDKDDVYMSEKKIVGADAESFKIIPYYNYLSEDKDHIYFKGEPLVGADLETFEIIDSSYQKDKNVVYYNGEVIEGADAETFELVPGQHEFATDKDSVFCLGYEIELDPENIVVLANSYARDLENVYHLYFKIEDPDVATFTVVEGCSNFAVDKNHIYRSSEIATMEEVVQYQSCKD